LPLVAVTHHAAQLLHRYVHSLAPGEFTLKGQATAIQRAAFAQPDLFPIYGSSELVKPIPDKASLFFARYPTDFEAFPVGRAGFTSLIIYKNSPRWELSCVEKRSRVSLSPSWFFRHKPPTGAYSGNFSHMQACELILSRALSHDLKRDIARRMLEFPGSLENHPALSYALQKLARDSFRDRCEFALLTPYWYIQRAIQRAQDELETTIYILRHRAEFPAKTAHHPAGLHWEQLLAEAAQSAPLSRQFKEAHENRGANDAAFLDNVARAREWTDFELLLRELRELGAQPLILSMPLNGAYFDRIGVSPASRAVYIQHLRALAAQYNVALLDFEEYEQDLRFLSDSHDHLSVEGWMYFDKALDAFYHDRMNRL
jgi:D-alanine transfer protein